MNTSKTSPARITLVVLAVLGIIMMGYLTSLHYSPEEGSFCDIGEGLSCSTVNKSQYSEIMGIPMSILGLLYFLAVLLVALFRYNNTMVKLVGFFSIVFMGPSVYLSLIEYFVINEVCIFCEVSKVIIIAIIVTTFVALGSERLKAGAVAGAVVLAVLAGGLTYAIQKSAIPSDRYNEFAQCLTEKRLYMYGSITCSFCARQRANFGDAFEYITEIECDPRNPNPETERCITKNIEHTPTWILEDEEGNELYRFEPGVQTFEDLSRVSGCPLPASGE